MPDTDINVELELLKLFFFFGHLQNKNKSSGEEIVLQFRGLYAVTMQHVNGLNFYSGWYFYCSCLIDLSKTKKGLYYSTDSSDAV